MTRRGASNTERWLVGVILTLAAFVFLSFKSDTERAVAAVGGQVASVKADTDKSRDDLSSMKAEIAALKVEVRSTNRMVSALARRWNVVPRMEEREDP